MIFSAVHPAPSKGVWLWVCEDLMAKSKIHIYATAAYLVLLTWEDSWTAALYKWQDIYQSQSNMNLRVVQPLRSKMAGKCPWTGTVCPGIVLSGKCLSGNTVVASGCTTHRLPFIHLCQFTTNTCSILPVESISITANGMHWKSLKVATWQWVTRGAHGGEVASWQITTCRTRSRGLCERSR